MATLHAVDRAGLDFPSKEALRDAVSSGAVRYLHRVGPDGLADVVDVADVNSADVIIGPTFYARPAWIARVLGGQIV